MLTGIALAVTGLETGAMLTHDFIFDVILPPLLFEAALSIRWRELRRDMLPVVVLSTLGVGISAFVVAVGMMQFLAWPTAAGIVFGVLISATDPIAVLAMFKDTGVKGRLRLLLESESLFNDGVAAVLYFRAPARRRRRCRPRPTPWPKPRSGLRLGADLPDPRLLRGGRRTADEKRGIHSKGSGLRRFRRRWRRVG